jgi:sulfur transfer complex TusBCD TusB component (DsrH family)
LDSLLIELNGLLIELNGLGLGRLPHIIVDNSHTVVQFVYLLLKLINAGIGLFEISDGHLILPLLVVSHASVIVIVVKIDFVLTQLGRNIHISQLIKDIDEVLMGSLELLVLLDRSEIPHHSLLVSLQIFAIQSDAVVARCIERSLLDCFLLPSDGVFVFLLGITV